MDYMKCILDAVVGLPVKAVIGSVFLGLLLTSPVGLAYTVNLRRKEQKDIGMGLLLIAIAANVVGMAIAIGHVRYLERGPSEIGARPNTKGQDFPFFLGRPRLSDFIAERVVPPLFSEWDTDRDGRLSTGEASAAVAAFIKFIKSTASDKGDSGDEATIRKAFADAIEPYFRAPWQSQAAPKPTGGEPPKSEVPEN